MKPGFILVDWSRGEVVGVGSESECREQLAKALKHDERWRDSYLIAEVRVLSEMKRVES